MELCIIMYHVWEVHDCTLYCGDRAHGSQEGGSKLWRTWTREARIDVKIRMSPAATGGCQGRNEWNRTTPPPRDTLYPEWRAFFESQLQSWTRHQCANTHSYDTTGTFAHMKK